MDKKKQPPAWVLTEKVEITCVGASDETALYVFLIWKAGTAWRSMRAEDMFVLTCDKETVLVNGVPIDAEDKDIETICRMTDATIMGPHGPAIGLTITTSAAAHEYPAPDHDCPKERFLSNPITQHYGVGGEMVHLVPCPTCDARKQEEL